MECAYLYAVERRFFRFGITGFRRYEGRCLQGIHDTVCNSLCNLVKTGIKEVIIGFAVQKTHFDEQSRHFCPAEDGQIGTCFHTKITESKCFQIAVDIFRHGKLLTGEIIKKCLNTRILSRIGGHISVNGDKVISIDCIGKLGFLDDGLRKVSGPCIFDIVSGL